MDPEFGFIEGFPPRALGIFVASAPPRRVSDHMVWILQCLYHDQVGTVRGSSGTSRAFDIRQGVRQRCVLSPRLFACVLQWALRSRRARVEHYGLDFEDGMAPLLDLRFADE